MKKITIIYNPRKKETSKLIKKISEILKKHSAKILVTTPDKAIPESDLCITLGGDGTILKAGRRIAGMKIPVLGINLGSLGFLAEFSFYEFTQHLNEILNAKLPVEKRIMLDIKLENKKTGKSFSNTAVNDCIAHVGQSLRVGIFKVKLDGEFLAEYKGDGVIISTPTGSTAYSLAAQGPIIMPCLNVFTITPICPHTLSQRSVIVDSGSIATIEIMKNKYTETMMMSVDGQESYKLSADDVITVKKSKNHLLLIKHPTKSYFKVLENKLGWG